MNGWYLLEASGETGNKEPAAASVGPYHCSYLNIPGLQSQSEDSSPYSRAKAENSSGGDRAGFPCGGVWSDIFKGLKRRDRKWSQEDSLGVVSKGVEADTSPSRTDDVQGQKEKSQRGSLQCPSGGSTESWVSISSLVVPGGSRPRTGALYSVTVD